MVKDITGYMNAVKRQLKRAGDLDGKYFDVFSQEVDTYRAEHPAATPAEIGARFGRPSAQVSEFLQSLPNDEVRERLTSRRRLFTFLKIVATVLAAAIIILMTIFVADTWSFNHGYGEYSPVQSGPYEGNPNAIERY